MNTPSASPGGSDPRKPSRRILRRILGSLGDAASAAAGGQARLDHIVRTIAENMGTDVCSLYLRRAGDTLELFASHGLNPESVHRTRLRIGEGVIGDIAAYAMPRALAAASKYRNFARRPETGEDDYKSLMGAPILRGGRVLGVLAVQTRVRRRYRAEEIQALEAACMLVAEMLAQGGIVSRAEQTPVDGLGLRPLRLDGAPLSPGVALGHAVPHRPLTTSGPLVAEDPRQERRRLDAALAQLQAGLDRMLESVDGPEGGAHVDILRTYRMLAADRGWIRRIRNAIDSGLTAAAAVVQVENDMRRRMATVQDAYLRERLLDLEAVAYRLLRHLSPEETSGAPPDPAGQPEQMIIVARNMSPADLLDYDRARLKGVVLEEGSATAHVAIMARALDIPMIGRVPRLLGRVEAGDRIVVDGDHGLCFIRPGEEYLGGFVRSVELRRRRREAWMQERQLPPVTRDGTRMTLNMNAGLLTEMSHLDALGAAGVGLCRTEVMFMLHGSYPDVAVQTDFYRRMLEAAGPRPVVFRTLDAGGDKVLPYFPAAAEENPAMGWRAIRMGLDRPLILRRQLQALARAAAGRSLRVMFPMISEISEFLRARDLLRQELDRAAAEGREPPADVAVGTMLEVPALLFQLPALLRHVDFVAVGSNDLMQFLFASDRGNPLLERRYDGLSPAFLSVMRGLARRCRDSGTPLSLCGEMASDPVAAMALAGVGFRSLSLSPWSIGPVRTMIRSLDLALLEPYIDSLLDNPAHSLRNRLRDFARDHGIVLENAAPSA